MDKKLVIEKIKKLFSLATSSNPHEAEAAANAAQSLLTKYNLTQKEVAEETSEGRFKTKSFDTGKKRADPSWVFVQAIVRKFFFVEIVSFKKQVKTDFWTSEEVSYLILGEEHNILVAEYVIEFLTRSFKNAFKAHAKTTGRNSGRSGFYAGMYAGLASKLEVNLKKVENETGLVVVEDFELKKFVDEALGKPKERRAKLSGRMSDYESGVKEGKNLNIAMGVGSRSEPAKEVGQVLKLTGGGL